MILAGNKMTEVLNLIFTIILSIVSTVATFFWAFHIYDKELALRLAEIENRIKVLEDKGTTNTNDMQDEINLLTSKVTRQTKLFFRLINYINIEIREKINQLVGISGNQELLTIFQDDRSNSNNSE